MRLNNWQELKPYVPLHPLKSIPMPWGWVTIMLSVVAIATLIVKAAWQAYL